MDMKGKTVLITGSIDGAGRYVAKRLAADGANARSAAQVEPRTHRPPKPLRERAYSAMRFGWTVVTPYGSSLGMIFSENRCTQFGIMP
jgi:NAD(P)-dependent dehydrogenase (short-subunit alcohol dehydrogenase family)